MKQKIALTISIIFVLALSACRSGTNDSEEGLAYPDPVSSSMEKGYPVEEKQATGESAYPITEANREILMKTWSLVSLTENGTIQDVQPQTLLLNTDGTYTLTKEKEVESGAWTANLSGDEPSLAFYPESGDTSNCIIIELNETLLHLRSWQDNLQIDKIYLPAD